MRRNKKAFSIGVVIIIAVLSTILLSACSNERSHLAENDVGETVYHTETEPVATDADNSTDSTDPENGAILGWVVSAADSDIKIQNAAVTAINTQTGEEFSASTDVMGYFEVIVPAGTYSLLVKAEGYEDLAWPSDDEPISVDNESVDHVADRIEMKPITSSLQKRLSSVLTYQNGEKSEEYHFTYNDIGQVVSLIAYRYEDGNAVNWYTQNYEYDGNGNLILKEHIYSRGTNSCQYEYSYDPNGRITKYSFVDSWDADTYIFSYDDQGRVIGRRNEYGSSVEKFSYDESEKIVYESSELYSGDIHFIETTVYDHSYAPLVITTNTSESKEHGSSSSKSISFMPHWNLVIASCAIDDLCSFDVDPSGYLLRVTDPSGRDVYVCTYEEVIS